MNSFEKSSQDLEIELEEQVLALRALSQSYDDGNHWEAKRLAATIYILFHDGRGRTRSLLGQLGLKDRIFLPSSKLDLLGPMRVQGFTPVLQSNNRLVMMSVSVDKSEYIPILDTNPHGTAHPLMFYDDWIDETVFGETIGTNLTRNDITQTLRNQDGGSHVDSHIRNEQYQLFKDQGAPGMPHIDGAVTFGASNHDGQPVINGVRATMRQIAWEVDQALIGIGL